MAEVEAEEFSSGVLGGETPVDCGSSFVSFRHVGGDALLQAVSGGVASPQACLGQLRVDSGKGQNRTLRPLSAFWPTVFAGEQDVGPPKELGLDGQPGVFPLSDYFAEMGGIPVNDDGGEQV